MTPPDRLSKFELLKLMHKQKLDFSHAQVGELLDEVERLTGTDSPLRDAYLEGYGAGQVDGERLEREACARVAEGGSFFHHESPAAVFGRDIAAAIRRRGNTGEQP